MAAADDLAIVFLQHGMDGSSFDFEHFALTLERQFRLVAGPGRRILVWNSNANKGRTPDGVAEMANRSAAEFADLWRRDLGPEGARPKRVFLGLVGHSIGGLICRYLARILLLEGEGGAPSLLDGLTGGWTAKPDVVPLSFMTVASPHLGVRRPTTVPSENASTAPASLYSRILGTAAKQVAQLKMGLSGKELLVSDDRENPMVLRLCRPPFSDALRRFRNRTVAGSTVNDVVPYCSALIRSRNPFVKESEFRIRFEQQGLEVNEWSGFDPRTAELYADHMRRVLACGDPARAREMEDGMPKGDIHRNAQHVFELPPICLDPVGTKHYLSEPFPMPIVKRHGHTVSQGAAVASVKAAEGSPAHKRSISAATIGSFVRSFALGSSPLTGDRTSDAASIAASESATLVASETTSGSTGLLEPAGTGPARPVSAPPSTKSDATVEAADSLVGRQTTTDSPPSVEFPPQLMIEAQACFAGVAPGTDADAVAAAADDSGTFRRVSLTICMKTHPALFFMQTHPMLIGKTVAGVARDVVEVGWRSSELLARIICVDYLVAVGAARAAEEDPSD
ncbi:putative serine esterase-domain-containing protein [Hyaloraphidium curvatum]|nr:putative serine esterase-domain-containing protein [Hyaloraphidium curvatum]